MAKAKGAGGKLNKSETVQVRFDPILKMAAELAAAKERRTLSSFTEWAVEQAVQQNQVARDKEGNPVNARQVAQECWDSNPPSRLSLLATRYPDLLTIRERKIMEAISWVHLFVGEVGDAAPIIESLLRIEGWDDFCQYADDQISLEDVLTRLRTIRTAMQDRIITTTERGGDTS
ncbi:MAG TPA: hypothetical protein P5102_15185 [Candidatus Competibacteraceae bacterium]|nr:hypothetical protein [Candidatus Competibacteraceae bacterium]HSA47749.1 hypothetical protein [Candidatus Competibacteraceae bacterium]